jgi:hypothetical protein
MNDLDRSMHRSLWVEVTHSLFIEGSHTTKNTASVYVSEKFVAKVPLIGTQAFLALTSWVVRQQVEKNYMWSAPRHIYSSNYLIIAPERLHS